MAVTQKLKRANLFSVGLSSVTLVINLCTGVMAARALGADGRGILAGSIAAAQFFGWLGSVGGRQALGYRVAGDPAHSRQLLGTWLCIFPVAALTTLAISEVLLPVLFSAQSAAALSAARIFMLAAVGVLAFDVLSGVTLGHQEFIRWNIYRFLQPVLLLAGYGTLLITGHLTTNTALASNAISLLTPALALGADQVRRYGVGRPSIKMARGILAFGLRSHLGTFSGQINGRLDVLVMPAVLAASAIGFYAVAVNVSGMILAVTGTLNYLTLPAARAAGAQVVGTVHSGVVTSLGIGLVGACFLAATGWFLLPAVYGQEFRRSVAPMLALLPGCVLLNPGNVLIAGIEALGRPGLGSVPQGISVVITVVGLALFLKSGGAMAAAIVSSAAYSAVFLASWWLFHRLAASRGLLANGDSPVAVAIVEED